MMSRANGGPCSLVWEFTVSLPLPVSCYGERISSLGYGQQATSGLADKDNELSPAGCRHIPLARPSRANRMIAPTSNLAGVESCTQDGCCEPPRPLRRLTSGGAWRTFGNRSPSSNVRNGSKADARLGCPQTVESGLEPQRRQRRIRHGWYAAHKTAAPAKISTLTWVPAT